MSDSRVEEIRSCVNALLPREDLVLSYDRSFIDDLPHILKENFNIKDASEASNLPPLKKLLSLLFTGGLETVHLAKLPDLLGSVGIDRRAYVPLASTQTMEDNANKFSRWSRSTAEENADAVLALQRDLGIGQYNESLKRYSDRWEQNGQSLRSYMFGVTTVPPTFMQRLTRRSFWELRIAYWKLRGFLDSDSPSLSIGPRWVTEIEFFRQIVGLRGHVGLDLFSDDEVLVKSGDMHQMPFPDRYFQFVFIKNTTDKSYDIRKLVSELLRVTRPGGIIVVDQICGYGECSPLTRTDIQKSENLLRIFRSRKAIDVLVQDDIDLNRMGRAVAGRDRANNNARLAIRLPS